MGGAIVQGVVDLGVGRVRGRRTGDVWAFAGVPYARAPVGSLRWRPPEPPEPWSGVRPATDPGPIAPQPPPVPGLSVPGDPTEQSEDCLTLGLWTPGLDDRRRPVLVWVHGGAFTGGTGSSVLYRGDLLAGEQDVVVVTCNYRLGALGFLSHPALAAPGGPSGNWGLLDQVAALRWVRQHVAAFGGDPGNVTVFGESAGSMSICALLAMPAARGLFRRAILQSGPPFAHTAERAARVADELAGVLGTGAVDRERLEKVPAHELVAAVGGLRQQPAAPGELPLPVAPVVDGRSLPVDPWSAVESGGTRGVSLLVGTTRDELAFFVLGDLSAARMGDAELHARLEQSAPMVPPAEVVAAYRSVRRSRDEPTSAADLWIAAGTDFVFRWPSLRLAAAHAGHTAHAGHAPGVFVYLFTWETPAFGGMLGACHAVDIPFVFGTLRHPEVAHFAGEGPEAEALSADMRAAWAAFARSGDPSHDGLGRWAPWDPSDQATMVLGRRRGIERRPRSEELAVWDRYLPLAPARAGAAGGPGALGDGGAVPAPATMEPSGEPGETTGAPAPSGT